MCVLLGALLAGMMGCGFVTSDCDRCGSLGYGSGLWWVCVCVLLGVLVTSVMGLPLCLSSFFFLLSDLGFVIVLFLLADLGFVIVMVVVL